MKLPRGFGKNYFSLNAITATVNQVTLCKEASRVQSFHLSATIYSEELENEEEFEELCILQMQQLSLKSCHCNCFFRLLTRKTLKLFPSAKKYHNYYNYLNTSISPPLSNSTKYKMI